MKAENLAEYLKENGWTMFTTNSFYQSWGRASQTCLITFTEYKIEDYVYSICINDDESDEIGHTYYLGDPSEMTSLQYIKYLRTLKLFKPSLQLK